MKKIISLIAAFAMSASLFSVAQAGSQIQLTMDVTGGTKAGETVKVTVKYANAPVVAYDDDEGAGDQVNAYGFKVNIPGGIAASGKQFVRKGALATNLIGGSMQGNFNTTTGTIAPNAMGGDMPATTDGELFSMEMVLAEDIPAEGLAFTFDKSVDSNITFVNMVDYSDNGTTSYYSSKGDVVVIDPAVFGKSEDPATGDYEVAEKGYGVDAEGATVASYYTIMFNNGLVADNATIAISKDATKEWKITDLPEIAASAKITWVFNGLTDGLYDVVKVLDGETELSAE